MILIEIELLLSYPYPSILIPFISLYFDYLLCEECHKSNLFYLKEQKNGCKVAIV